jgi:hypothetical protein
MILWAAIACAAVGFALGMQCRLVPLAVASALVAVCWPLLPPASESTLVIGGLTILGLLFILQAFFLAGAMMGLRSPPLPASRSPAGVPGGQPRLRVAATVSRATDIGD